MLYHTCLGCCVKGKIRIEVVLLAGDNERAIDSIRALGADRVIAAGPAAEKATIMSSCRPANWPLLASTA
jgi:cation transport ATPase